MQLRFGPLLRHWTMRYEAKHSYFKKLVTSIGNFINLPYSLAMRHQQHQCLMRSSVTKEDTAAGPGTAWEIIVMMKRNDKSRSENKLSGSKRGGSTAKLT